MGTRERRQREVAEREQRFLDAARELIQQDGLLNLQMCRVAEKCDYAVGTLYQHFVSKEDLLVALVSEEAQKRVDLFTRVQQWAANTRDRMLGFSVADMLYVRYRPEHFRLLQFVFTDVVWGAAPVARRQACVEAHAPLRQATLAVIDEAIANGDLDPCGLRPDEICVAPWALSIGLHAIVHTDGLVEQHASAEAYGLMLRHFSNLLNGLGWKPLADSSDAVALDALTQRLCSEVLHDEHCQA